MTKKNAKRKKEDKPLKDNRPTEKEFLSFIQLISKLDHLEFIGIAQIMSVKLLDEEKKEREFEDMFSDILDRFIELPKKRRKEIMKLLKGELKVGVRKNGNDTKAKSE